MNLLNRKAIEVQTKVNMTKGEIAEKVNSKLTKPMKGATAVEYVLIVSIMATVIIIAWRTLLKPAIEGRMGKVSEEITSGV